jgi:hypothetical protein
VRFPASPDAPVPSGFAKRELTNIHEIRKFENRINSEERRRWDERKTREEMTFNEQRQQRHAELRQAMQRMSPYGRDFAQIAMEQTNGKRRGNYDAQFRVDVFSNDSSNRDPHCDRSTGWRDRRV